MHSSVIIWLNYSPGMTSSRMSAPSSASTRPMILTGKTARSPLLLGSSRHSLTACVHSAAPTTKRVIPGTLKRDSTFCQSTRNHFLFCASYEKSRPRPKDGAAPWYHLTLRLKRAASERCNVRARRGCGMAVHPAPSQATFRRALVQTAFQPMGGSLWAARGVLLLFNGLCTTRLPEPSSSLAI